MKAVQTIAGITQTVEEAAAIPMATLNKRIQDEMVALVILAAEVQIALGPTLAEAKTLSPAVQRSLQAIDRLHQTLDDLQRVMGHLASANGDQAVKIEPLSDVIRLRHLAHKLFDNIDAPFALSEDDSGEIAWF
ncbi:MULTISPECIES: hypothetical protein [Roseobacteraceae]|uniref:Uncharacterized protein n=1 Tax=Celeribacter baekdonensis B30 TaxID=1208323 RepID=K2JQI7_9RHOB|nr:MULTISPECIES: hypothetical protein [Roseobacteraceae]EKE72674.1 hypothetical protein B30_06821 [Celeribacter baekdonensis B30]KAB6715364.1 hypothetical protein C8029_15550 [Roseobacter sp. TSBP12]|tara:strand:- start:4670 stop:5071 length:402 start_codon:yes stop_codon:yes gene_type:complete